MQNGASSATLRERALAAGAYLVGGALLAVVPISSLMWKVSLLSPLFLVHVVAAPFIVAVYFAVTRKRSAFVRRHGRLALLLHVAMFLANCWVMLGIYSTECADVGCLYALGLFFIALPANILVGAVCVLIVLVRR